MIIAAYAATGKTTLAKLYPEKFVDFVCMPYKYQLEPDENCGETCKANPDNVMRDDWPYNYVYAIMEIMNSGNSITVSGLDFLAAAFCHEIDHLDGILFTDKTK